jgi:hypothetical protein
VNSFKTVLASLLDAASPNGWTYTIAFPNSFSGVQTYKYTYTVTGNGGSQPTFTMVAGNTVHEQMGFSQSTAYTFVGDTLTSANVVRFQLEDALYLHSDLVGAGQNNVLETIYTGGVSDMGIIKFEAKSVDMSARALRTTSQNVYHFSLQNENGIVIQLNGENLNFELMLFSFQAPPASKTAEEKKEA